MHSYQLRRTPARLSQSFPVPSCPVGESSVSSTVFEKLTSNRVTRFFTSSASTESRSQRSGVSVPSETRRAKKAVPKTYSKKWAIIKFFLLASAGLSIYVAILSAATVCNLSKIIFGSDDPDVNPLIILLHCNLLEGRGGFSADVPATSDENLPRDSGTRSTYAIYDKYFEAPSVSTEIAKDPFGQMIQMHTEFTDMLVHIHHLPLFLSEAGNKGGYDQHARHLAHRAAFWAEMVFFNLKRELLDTRTELQALQTTTTDKRRTRQLNRRFTHHLKLFKLHAEFSGKLQRILEMMRQPDHRLGSSLSWKVADCLQQTATWTFRRLRYLKFDDEKPSDLLISWVENLAGRLQSLDKSMSALRLHSKRKGFQPDNPVLKTHQKMIDIAVLRWDMLDRGYWRKNA